MWVELKIIEVSMMFVKMACMILMISMTFNGILITHAHT